jgi:hypothetical protein
LVSCAEAVTPMRPEEVASARRFGEPIRAAGGRRPAERSWLWGPPTPGEERRAAAARPPAWSEGGAHDWLRRLDADRGLTPPPAIDPAGVAEPYRLELAGSFEAAAAMWATLSAPYDQALALVDAGTADSTRAGLDLLDRLGADQVAAKVRQDLRRRGTTVIPSRRREATLANPAGLTSRQVEILARYDGPLTRDRPAAVHLHQDGRPPRSRHPVEAAGHQPPGRAPRRRAGILS